MWRSGVKSEIPITHPREMATQQRDLDSEFSSKGSAGGIHLGAVGTQSREGMRSSSEGAWAEWRGGSRPEPWGAPWEEAKEQRRRQQRRLGGEASRDRGQGDVGSCGQVRAGRQGGGDSPLCPLQLTDKRHEAESRMGRGGVPGEQRR